MGISLNELLEMMRWAINGLTDLCYHAAWSGLASLLGFWLTCWVMHGLYFVLASLSHLETSIGSGLERDIQRFGFSVALFASLSAHLWWDGLLGPLF